MPRKIKSGLIQCANVINDESKSIKSIQEAALEHHIPFIEKAGKNGVNILCLQEIFNGPYFCPSQDSRWYDAAEKIPGPTVEFISHYAKKYEMVIIIPIYEVVQPGIYYNSAAVVDADGTYMGKYRKKHIPHTNGFWEKFFFKPGDKNYPIFNTRYAKIGIYICYDRHFPEGARILGLKGAEIVYNPSATVAGLSQYLWKLEQPAHAVANGYFMGCINRVGIEKPWKIGKFYGNSYHVSPLGEILNIASENDEELITSELDLDMIDKVRNTWQFYRDRRPETYNELLKI
jgi:N-carbamoylputrescine amidase